MMTWKYNVPNGISNITKENKNFHLSQNYPNPFNPKTKIRFTIPKGNDNFVQLIIYNSLGQIVEKLIQENLGKGEYEVEWSGIEFNSGIYFYKLITKDFEASRKMILIK